MRLAGSCQIKNFIFFRWILFLTWLFVAASFRHLLLRMSPANTNYSKHQCSTFDAFQPSKLIADFYVAEMKTGDFFGCPSKHR